VNTQNLTDRQISLYRTVLEALDREPLPVWTLLQREPVSQRDRAAVADVFTPGAGADYR
jgi:hypothetical protein